MTGRSKDTIIVAGANHYPQDIEHTVGGSHALLRRGCCAAIAVPVERREALVVVAETNVQVLRPPQPTSVVWHRQRARRRGRR